MIGPPGAGKGSLSRLCVTDLGWVQLSTGNLCRKHIAEQTKIGKKIAFATKSGKLVDSKLITQMVVGWFTDHVDTVSAIILDGYPRTVVQARAFNELLQTTLTGLALQVVRLLISDDKAVNRLCNRFICQNKNCQFVYSLAPGSSLTPKNNLTCDYCANNLARRADDSSHAIRERLTVYHKHEQGLLDFYRSIGQEISDVDVDKPLSNVFERFKQVIS